MKKVNHFKEKIKFITLVILLILKNGILCASEDLNESSSVPNISSFYSFPTFSTFSTFSDFSIMEMPLVPNCENGMCVIFSISISIEPERMNSGLAKIEGTVKGPDGQEIHKVLTIGFDKKSRTCKKDVWVPEPAYKMITSALQSIADTDPKPPVLTPTQQSILLMYVTMMEQTKNFDCAKLQ